MAWVGRIRSFGGLIVLVRVLFGILDAFGNLVEGLSSMVPRSVMRASHT